MSRVQALDIAEVEKPSRAVKPLLAEGNLDIVKNVKVRLEVRIGEAELTVEELLGLGKGSIVPLMRSTMEPVDLLIDGKVVARGHLVAADDNFGIQVSEING